MRCYGNSVDKSRLRLSIQQRPWKWRGRIDTRDCKMEWTRLDWNMRVWGEKGIGKFPEYGLRDRQMIVPPSKIEYTGWVAWVWGKLTVKEKKKSVLWDVLSVG